MKHVKIYEDFLNEASKPGRAGSGKLENLDNLFSWMYDNGILNKGEKGEKDNIFRQYYRWYNDGDFPAKLKARGVSKWMGDAAIEKGLEEVIEEFMKKILNKYTGKYDRREFHIDTLLGDLNTLENIVAGYENRETKERGEPDPYGLLNYWGKKINTGDSEFEKMLGELGPLYKVVDAAANKALGPGYEQHDISYRREKGKETGAWNPDLEKKYMKMKEHMLKMHEILKTAIEATKRAKAALGAPLTEGKKSQLAEAAFSVEDGIKIQSEQLAEWKKLLQPKVYKDLEKWATEHNDKAESGNQIIRGSDMSNFIGNYFNNYTPPNKRLYEESHGLNEALKSKKQLFSDLEKIDPERFKGADLGRPHISDETYGDESMIYVSWADPEERKKGEAELKKMGHKVNSYDEKGKSSEVQVSYFKGLHWDI